MRAHHIRSHVVQAYRVWLPHGTLHKISVHSPSLHLLWLATHAVVLVSSFPKPTSGFAWISTQMMSPDLGPSSQSPAGQVPGIWRRVHAAGGPGGARGAADDDRRRHLRPSRRVHRRVCGRHGRGHHRVPDRALCGCLPPAALGCCCIRFGPVASALNTSGLACQLCHLSRRLAACLRMQCTPVMCFASQPFPCDMRCLCHQPPGPLKRALMQCSVRLYVTHVTALHK